MPLPIKKIQLTVKDGSEYKDGDLLFNLDAQAWARGTRAGQPVSSTDETYHNNAKYYVDSSVGAITTAATTGLNSVNSAATSGVSSVNAAATNAIANFPATAEVCDSLIGNFAPTYVANQAYSIGDYVTYQYQLYKCKVRIEKNEDSTFVSDHWVIISTGNDLANLRNAFNTTLNPDTFQPTINERTYIDNDDGKRKSSAGAYCTSTVYNGYGYRAAVILDSNIYEYKINYYNSGYNLSSGAGYANLYTNYRTGLTYLSDAAPYFVITFRRRDLATLSDADFTAILAAWSCYRPTDQTLTKLGMAADAKAVGDAITNVTASLGDAITGITASLSEYTVVSTQSVNSNMAMSGSANNGNITWTRTDSTKNEITINGTSTSTSVININTLGATNTRPLIFGAAMETVYSKIVFNTTDSTNSIKLNILVYKSGGGYDSYLLDYDNNTVSIKTDKTTTAVLCRYQLIAQGTVSNDIVSFNINMIVPHYLESTGDNTNMQRAIKRRFDLCNKCILGPGVFYITSTVDLSNGAHLIGSGSTTTQIIYTGTENAITASYDAEISDIWIRGASEDIDISSTEGTKNGVYITGESSSVTSGVLITNCIFSNFNGNGIKALNTGYPTRGFIISNCVFRNNYCGINLNKKTEYWKISNVISRLNYYGIIDNGGNNLITNSGFDSNEIGLYIDDEDGTHSNNTHGSFSNCTMNHSGTAAIKTLGTGSHLLETGMMFSNCQFFYGGLNLDHVYGFGFNNCNFGSETPITINASQSVIFSNCLFRLVSDSPITITNSTNKIIRFFNCYTRYGTVITEDPQA